MQLDVPGIRPQLGQIAHDDGQAHKYPAFTALRLAWLGRDIVQLYSRCGLWSCVKLLSHIKWNLRIAGGYTHTVMALPPTRSAHLDLLCRSCDEHAVQVQVSGTTLALPQGRCDSENARHPCDEHVDVSRVFASAGDMLRFNCLAHEKIFGVVRLCI